MIEQTCHIKSTKILWIHHYFSTNFKQFINQTPVIITSKLKDHVKDLLTVALFYESEIFATPPPPLRRHDLKAICCNCKDSPCLALYAFPLSEQKEKSNYSAISLYRLICLS